MPKKPKGMMRNRANRSRTILLFANSRNCSSMAALDTKRANRSGSPCAAPDCVGHRRIGGKEYGNSITALVQRAQRPRRDAQPRRQLAAQVPVDLDGERGIVARQCLEALR